MRKMSIIWKVTIWYTIFLCILAVIIVSVTYLVSGRIVNHTSKSHLIELTSEAAEEIEYEDGVLETDDEVDFLDDGVYLSIYDEEKHFLFGLVPKNYDYNQSYSEKTLVKQSISGEDWYIYEIQKTVVGYGNIVIRGMVRVSEGVGNQTVTTKVLLLLSPIIILVATVGGYILTKHAFSPIHQMRKTVEQITSGKDLTKRVNLGDGEDELYKLGKTFDRMFERLENAFEREKQFTSDVSHELRSSQCDSVTV